jgi:hypothetical protein
MIQSMLLFPFHQHQLQQYSSIEEATQPTLRGELDFWGVTHCTEEGINICWWTVRLEGGKVIVMWLLLLLFPASANVWGRLAAILEAKLPRSRTSANRIFFCPGQFWRLDGKVPPSSSPLCPIQKGVQIIKLPGEEKWLLGEGFLDF